MRVALSTLTLLVSATPQLARAQEDAPTRLVVGAELDVPSRYVSRGVALSSPFFGFGLKVPAWKAFAGRTLSRLVPALAMPTDIDPAIVSHDPEVGRQYKSEPLNGRTATARWFTEMLRVHAETPAAACCAPCAAE